MRIHYRSQLGTRLAGTATGLGFVLIGLYAMFGAGEEVAALARDRAFGFGLTALIGGVWAVSVSWLAEDLGNIWCRPPPRRWR